MRINLVDSPRKVATIPRSLRLHMRVISGTVLLSRDEQTLRGGGGLPVAVADGIVSLEWETGEVWMAGSSGTAEVETIIP